MCWSCSYFTITKMNLPNAPNSTWQHFPQIYIYVLIVRLYIAYISILVWTLCLMHRCVISTCLVHVLVLFLKNYLFYFFIFMCFLLFFIIKIKWFFFPFVFLFIWMQIWSLEKENTPHSFSSRVFLHYYNFYFFLFSTLYLVSSFL
jgi:hypothetical protein